MTKIKKSVLLSAITLLAAVALVLPTISFSVTTSVTNEIELQNALNDPNTDIIVLANDISVSNTIILPDQNRTITIQADNTTRIYGNGTDYIFRYDTNSSNLNINFSNVEIDGSNSSGFLYIDAQNGYLTVNQLNFINGSSSSRTDGGAIYKQSGTLNLNYGNISNSFTAGLGGGIYNALGNLNIINCEFNNNYSESNGGAIYNTPNGELTILDSKFINNRANRTGGAIYTQGNTDISSTSFENNNTDYSGGCIYTENSTINIKDSNFTNSLGGSFGGAICSDNSNVTLTNNDFNVNHATEGGAVFNTNGVYNIENNRFTNNDATAGGAIYSNNSNIIITNSDFSDNHATVGGAIYSDNYNDTVINSNFINNSATEGGAIFNSEGILRVEGNSSFQFNSANQGGAIYTNDLKNVFINGNGQTVNFSGNHAAFPTSIEYFPEYIDIHNQQVTGNYTTSITPYLYNNYDINFGLLPVTHNLNYDQNTADIVYNMPGNESYVEGQTVIVSSQIPNRVGYVFEGWNTQPDRSGTQYNPGDTFIMPGEDVTLYAQWTVITYNLRFDPNTTDPVINIPADINYNYGEQVTIPNDIPQRSGYTFKGWNTRSDGAGTMYQPGETIIGPEGGLTLYAQWEPIAVNIVYDGNTTDPVQNLPATESRIPGESTILSTQVPTRAGYTFAGWNTNPNGTGTLYQPGESIIVPENGLTLYAQWIANQEVLVFNPNTTDPVQNIPSNINYIPGESVTITSEIPLRDNYSFTGWNTSPDGSGTEYQPGETIIGPEGGLTLYAQWDINAETVVFNPNTTDPVENIPGDIDYRPGENVTIPGEVPTRDGYTFTGWNTEPDGSGTQYQPGETIIGPEGGLTLYAQWEENTNPGIIIIVVTILGLIGGACVITCYAYECK